MTSISHSLLLLSSPSSIKTVESMFLTFESTDCNAYTLSLLCAFTTPDHGATQGDPQRAATVQLSALLCLKATIFKNWRPRGGSGLLRSKSNNVVNTETAPTTLTDVTKSHIRSTLQTAVTNTPQTAIFNSPMLNTLSLIIARVGRYDIAHEWPTIVPTLLSLVHNNTFALNCLNKLVKELATQRILSHKKNFEEVSSNTFGPLSNLYMSVLPTMLTSTQAMSSIPESGLVHLKILTKTIYKLIINTLPVLIAKHGEAVGRFFEQNRAAMGHLVRYFSTDMSESPNNVQLFKIIDRQARLVVDVQSNHPLHFAPFLTNYLQFFATSLPPVLSLTPLGTDNHLSKYIIRATNFLSNCNSCQNYATDASVNDFLSQRLTKSNITSKGDGSSNEENLRVGIEAVARFFTNERVMELAQVAVMRLMTLGKAAMGEWKEDPESYSIIESQAQPDYDLRSAGEQLFTSLIESSRGKDLLSTFVATQLADIDSQLKAARAEAGSPSSPPSPAVKQSILLWDAVYTAAGISSSILSDKVNFPDLFERSLLPSLTLLCNSSAPAAAGDDLITSLPILRHRVVWLLGCWIHTLTDSLRPQIYNILVSVLHATDHRSDALVKLSCVQTLNSVCEDWDFLVPAFVNLAAPAIQGLYRLLNEVVGLEPLTLILQTCGVIVARMGADLPAEAANAAVSPLSAIWAGTGETHQILRKHVMDILANVATVVNPQDAVLLYPVVLPMLQVVLGGGDDSDVVHLTEDALKLTLTLMRIAGSYEELFHGLFPKIAQIVKSGDWEHLRVCMMLLELYILNGGVTFLNSHATLVHDMFLSTIGLVKTKASGFVMLGMDALLRQFPAEGGRLLIDGGCIGGILECCHHVIKDRAEREPDVCLVQWMSVVARVLICNVTSLNGMMSQDGRGSYCFVVEDEGDGDMEEGEGTLTCDGLIRLFFEKFDSVGYGKGSTGRVRRRLWCLFLASLLPTGEGGDLDDQKVAMDAWGGSVLREMDSFVNLVVDVLTEEKEDGGVTAGQDDSFYDSEEETLMGGLAQYEAKVRESSSGDVVGRADLKKVVRGKMEGCCRLLGEARWAEVVGLCEPVVLQRAMQLLTN